ncbi:NlpC/P60 family protein [Devosia sp. XJ19-1]|uniref:NlpC/P60 family protein n=1 Tax=Devosia ureilytica TaxID=2952754 RepID=A0A9Q4AQJ6_9HYPH|nr:NlpC/P60 family protein [Devosia ureilytica]MCP8884245.1 NlpC/P60 family protein [Devosia ureilytica]MCP8887853.1 NlpC/P60 family protein [Devosia ureilytica]
MSPDRVVLAARAWLGTPYRHRASRPGAGCDCLGLLRGVWRTLYGAEPAAVPAYRADMRADDNPEALRLAAERFLSAETGTLAAGQVVLFRLGGLDEPRHCGIMVSESRFIHAQEHLGVVEANMTPGWAKRVSGRYRFPAASS